MRTRVVVFMLHAYTYGSGGIVYMDFYLSLLVPHLCLKSEAHLEFLAHVLKSEAQDRGRLSWIGDACMHGFRSQLAVV